MTNEEYTQILEQMIISLTGMELEELHEAVGGHLKEGTGYSAEEVKSGKQPSGRPHPEARFPGWKVGKNMLKKVKNVKKKSMIEDYQTPARNAQMQDMYDRAEGAFFKDLSSNPKLRKLRRIDNKNNAEQQSSRLYGKNGKLIKQTKKKRVRIGQPGGRQGGYQGGYQGGNQIGNY